MTVPAMTDLKSAIKPGYDIDWSTPNFLDKDGQPVAGIYADVSNEDYHAIPAVSSSKLKTFAYSPALYYRKYVAPLRRTKSASSEKSLTTGSVTHGLVLEPQRCNDYYWYHLNPADYPNALHTIDQIKEALINLGERPKGKCKSDYIDQLRSVSPAVHANVFDVIAQEHLMGWLRTRNLAWMTPNMADYPNALMSLADFHRVCASMNLTPVSDDFDALTKQLCTYDPTLVTISNIREIHAQRVMNTEPFKAYVKEHVLDPITYEDAYRARDTVFKHMRASSLLQDGVSELTFIAQDPETGLWVKAKFDYLRYDLISADLKTARETHPDKFASQVRELRYDLQEAFYCHVAKLLGVIIQGFCFVVVEFAEMDNCEVYEIGPKRRRKAEDDRRAYMQELQSCMERDYWYGFNANQTTMVLDF
ncbi:PD-(D/E)XK nuclease-like domain-containing protein [Aeromonas veronii]|uniref:PD-(D/E)XK nuclease-like domain-containing protein n=1 Tax=Aeromonas veronii TaxID=654 RepID=UPI00406BC6C6